MLICTVTRLDGLQEAFRLCVFMNAVYLNSHKSCGISTSSEVSRILPFMCEGLMIDRTTGPFTMCLSFLCNHLCLQNIVIAGIRIFKYWQDHTLNTMCEAI